jgi:hypothetical protein
MFKGLWSLVVVYSDGSLYNLICTAVAGPYMHVLDEAFLEGGINSRMARIVGRELDEGIAIRRVKLFFGGFIESNAAQLMEALDLQV